MTKKNRSDEEFEKIQEKFSNSIRSQVLSSDLLKMGIDPEDVLQEIKVRLWKKMGSEKKMTNPPSLKKVVSSVLIDEIRKARTQEKVVSRAMEEKIEVKMEAAEKLASGEYQTQIIEDALASLMESRRQVMRLHLLGLNVEEISAALRWSQDKTRNLLYRALADIKNKLMRKGVDDEN